MFSQPGFWVMIAGAVVCSYGFLGLAFSRLGHELPANNADKSPKEQPAVRRARWTAPLIEDEESEAEPPNPPSTVADRSEKTKPKR